MIINYLVYDLGVEFQSNTEDFRREIETKVKSPVLTRENLKCIKCETKIVIPFQDSRFQGWMIFRIEPSTPRPAEPVASYARQILAKDLCV